MNRYTSLLLIGPTGSGKTPLGDRCEERGLWGRRCAHFDFGASLRKIAAAGYRQEFFPDEDVDVIQNVLETGALLKDDQFRIARNALLSFAKEKKLENDDLLILNGLPRHAGQAGDVDVVAEVKVVLYLECSPDVIVERIRRNTGGDRKGRIDDTPDDIRRKWRIFVDQTMPLIEHYRQRKAWIGEYTVAPDTMPEDVYTWLNKKNRTRICADRGVMNLF